MKMIYQIHNKKIYKNQDKIIFNNKMYNFNNKINKIKGIKIDFNKINNRIVNINKDQLIIKIIKEAFKISNNNNNFNRINNNNLIYIMMKF
jgi:hypothetical protein